MKFYKITAHVGIPAVKKVKWVATQSDAASVRKELVSAGAKRADVETDEFDVPTAKTELLQWLNLNVVH